MYMYIYARVCVILHGSFWKTVQSEKYSISKGDNTVFLSNVFTYMYIKIGYFTTRNRKSS